MLYTEEENTDLDYTRARRIAMVDQLFANGAPTSSKDMRVANEILNGIDSSTHTKVANRLKHQETQNTEAILNTVTEALKSITAAKSLHNVSANVELDNVYIPTDLVPGELDVNPDKLDITDFIPKGE